MKRNRCVISLSIFAAASIASGTVLAQSSATQERETIRPDISSPSTSKGGTQSERTGETGTPLPEGSPFGGTVEMGQANTPEQVKAAQQALKDKGYDPGPIDGTMGPRTTEALKSFQNSVGLEQTGTLNAETAQKLGIDSKNAARGSGESSDVPMGSRDKPAANR